MSGRTFSAIVFLFAGLASAQEAPKDPFSIGVTMLSHAGCPLYVGGVIVGSPAGRAGIQNGDHILAIEGIPVADPTTAAHFIQSDRPGSVTVTLARGGQEFDAVVVRARQSVIYERAGKRMISGILVPPGTSPAEVDRMLSFDARRLVGRVFMRTHYPQNSKLFYGGFEMFILRDPDQVTVGGIEDGPAAKAGVHSGDVVLSVNGIPVSGKTVPELEGLFSGRESKMMQLQVERLDSPRTFSFRLERAEDIARQNGKRFVDGKIVPLWAGETDLHCFE
jgi:C-terminal processing protease CtpA/Prc